MILMISHYLSLISVCAYGCDYLFKRYSKDFLEYGGDKEWLERGYEVLPLKLQVMIDVSLKLAYCPWEIDSGDIVRLQSHWSRNQLVLGIIIICYYQSLACLCLSNAVLQEIDSEFYAKMEKQGCFYNAQKGGNVLIGRGLQRWFVAVLGKSS